MHHINGRPIAELVGTIPDILYSVIRPRSFVSSLANRGQGE